MYNGRSFVLELLEGSRSIMRTANRLLDFLARIGWTSKIGMGTAVSLGLLLSAALASDKLNLDWPLFRGDQAAQGVSSSELPEAPEVLWQFSVEKGAFEATP